MKLLPDGCVDAVITDPPYGVNMIRGDSKVRGAIVGDLTPPDVEWVASFPSVIWGGNNFCDQLPRSTGWLVWDKTFPECAEHSMAELAWTNGVKTIRKFTQAFHGFMRDREGRFHPTQKPVELMAWCIRFFPLSETILDPYCGSGSTLVAAKKLGRHFLGFEISEEYCQIARERLARIDAQPNLFEPKAEQLTL